MARTQASPEGSQVGDVLRRKREELGLDFEGASASGGLDPQTIRALERDDPAQWAADPRMLGSLRIYARLLGLVAEPLVADAWERAGGVDGTSEEPRVEPLRPGPAYPHGRQPRRRALAVVAVLAIVVAGVALVAIANQSGRGVRAGDNPADEDQSTGQETEAPQDDAEDAEAEAEPNEPEDADGGEEAGFSGDLPGRPPQETRVQVLDALGDGQAAAEAVEHLESLGYDIVLVDTTARPWPESVVLHEEGWATESESLADRSERFQAGGANTSFVDDADLHVVVGLDWTAEE